MLLKVEGLKVQFQTMEGVVKAVNDITYQINKKESLGIVGESGSGKSVGVLSLLRVIPMPPGRISSGRVLFEGKDLLNLNDKEINNIRGNEISMVFQDPITSLNPVLTIGVQLTEVIERHLGLSRFQAKKRAIELLDLVAIPSASDRMNDYPNQLSGGMRQRVMIAIALSCNPKLLIADEPTTALDVTVQAQIIDLVKRLRNEIDMAVIWITHDLGVVASVSERILVMYAGQILEDGLVEDIYSNPLHPYTAALLNSLPSLNKKSGNRLNSISGLPPDLYNLPKGCPFYERCDYRIDKCRYEKPFLEEIEPKHKVACWVKLENKKNNLV